MREMTRRCFISFHGFVALKMSRWNFVCQMELQISLTQEKAIVIVMFWTISVALMRNIKIKCLMFVIKYSI
jgi:hypothetical protein